MQKAVLPILRRSALLKKPEQHTHSVGPCYRCKKSWSRCLALQSFVKVRPLAEEAIKAVKDGRTRIIPSNWEKTYSGWMENIRDWCISRQIWWGHRIPAWYCQAYGAESITESLSAEIDPAAWPPAAAAISSRNQMCLTHGSALSGLFRRSGGLKDRLSRRKFIRPRAGDGL